MPSRLTDLHPIGMTFGGVHLSQTWADLYIWELVLNKVEPKIVIELGTYEGGFALYLEAQSRIREFEFYTFDNGQYDAKVGGLHFIRHFFALDVFTSKGFIEELTFRGKAIIFCDNGNKEEEVRIFSEFLGDEDLIAVHDWGDQCNIVPDSLQLYEPEPGIYEELKSPTRFFSRK